MISVPTTNQACVLCGALLLLVATTGVAAGGVPCNTGFVEYVCPDEYPVCCTWPENDVTAACCPSGSVCALNDGYCIAPHNSGTKNSGNTTPAPRLQDTNGVTVGVSEAAAFITFTAIGFIVAVVACAFFGFRLFLYVSDARRRRRDAERQRLLTAALSSSSESGSDCAASGDDDDEDAGKCTLCFSRRMECVLMPCGHVCACRPCATRLEQCPMCRTNVAKFVPFKTSLYIKHKAAPRPHPHPASPPTRKAAVEAPTAAAALPSSASVQADTSAVPIDNSSTREEDDDVVVVGTQQLDDDATSVTQPVVEGDAAASNTEGDPEDA